VNWQEFKEAMKQEDRQHGLRCMRKVLAVLRDLWSRGVTFDDALTEVQRQLDDLEFRLEEEGASDQRLVG
jgi:hypothetical protein